MIKLLIGQQGEGNEATGSYGGSGGTFISRNGKSRIHIVMHYVLFHLNHTQHNISYVIWLYEFQMKTLLLPHSLTGPSASFVKALLERKLFRVQSNQSIRIS